MRLVLSALAVLTAGAWAWGDDTPRYQTGAKPSPPAALLAAPRFLRDGTFGAPAQFARIPDKIHIWGNDRFGDCVTAEEAVAKIASRPHVWVSEQEVIDWARRNGVLNGATLVEVLREMRTRGLLASDGKRYQDGQAYVVDYRDRETLCAAIYKGPVKIAVASGPLIDSLNQSGGKNGWAGIDYRTNNRTDHCTAYLGYGPASFLYAELAKKYPEAKMPAHVRPDEFGLLMFTWGTIGFVDWDSHLAICREGWVRDPTTDGFPEPEPQPDPGPSPPPVPVDPPTPEPQPNPKEPPLWLVLSMHGAAVVLCLIAIALAIRSRKVAAILIGVALSGAATANAQSPGPSVPKGVKAPKSVADPYGAKSYADFLAKVNREGGCGILFVGVKDTLTGTGIWHYRMGSGVGCLADGVYDCWHDPLTCEPVMFRRTEPVPMVPTLTAEDWSFYLNPPSALGLIPQGGFGGS